MNFANRLDKLKDKVSGSVVEKVLGAPPQRIVTHAPSVARGKGLLPARIVEEQVGDIPEVAGLKWGEPFKPEAGVTFLASAQGFDLLTHTSENTRRQTAFRIARYLQSQPRWLAAGSDRSERSVAMEILCHAHPVNNDRSMSIEYYMRDTQSFRCRLIGFELLNDPPPDTPAPPDEVPVDDVQE